MTCAARRPRISPTPSPTTRATRTATKSPTPRSTTRTSQFELALPRRSAAEAFDVGVGGRVVAALDALPASRSSSGSRSGSRSGFGLVAGSSSAWKEFREGLREVFLTLTATFALGLGWAALEASWAEADRAPSGDAVDVATGYASLDPAPR